MLEALPGRRVKQLLPLEGRYMCCGQEGRYSNRRPRTEEEFYLVSQIIRTHTTNSEFISLLHLQGFSKVLNVPAWSQLCTTGALREDSSLGQKIKEKATLPEVSKGFPWEK